jgi:hypothetical protein
LPLEKFYKEKRSSDGKTGACKECLVRSQSEYIKNHVLDKKFYDIIYREKNREKLNKAAAIRHKERRDSDPLYRLEVNYRHRIYMALKAVNGTKSLTTKDLFGTSVELVWVHLEKQFRFPMTRPNYGKVWHVDHIRPVCSFDLSDLEQLKACFHYTNLQPLFIEENIEKGSKY